MGKKELFDKEACPFLKEDLKKIRKYFFEEKKIVVLAIINIGVNVALRYSDLSKIKFEDIDESFIIKIKEKKTSKKREIKLNKVCQDEIKNLKNYYKEIGLENFESGYIFKSLNRAYIKKDIDTPISIYSFNRYLKEGKNALNIPYNITSHSLRKTWGKYHYEKFNDIALIMKVLNHSSVEMTLRYIGIDREKTLESYDSILI